jgi:glucose-6-phosphate isomerase
MTIKLGRQFITPDIDDEDLLPRAGDLALQLAQGTAPHTEWTGWFDYPARNGFDLQENLVLFRQGLPMFYNCVVVVGIGGSYLGARAVADALSSPYAPYLRGSEKQTPGARLPMFFAGNNLSESALVELLECLDQFEPIVNVISKSGTTIEPSVAFRILRRYMEKRYADSASRRIVATTDAAKGALRRLATEESYATFEIPDDIGGRFSVLTAVGLLPLYLAGFDTAQLLHGADAFFSEFKKDPPNSPAVAYASLRQAAFMRDKRIEVLAIGDPKLVQFAEWWKQLFGESDGKEGRGLFPASMLYSTDLHSLGQYLQEGCRNLLETFLFVERNAPMHPQHSVERRLPVPAGDSSDGLDYMAGRYVDEINQAAMLGSALAHYEGGVPGITLNIPTISEFTLGYLFAFFETACAVGGFLADIHPFNQPGVEAYKQNLMALMGKPGMEELADSLKRQLGN